MALVVRADKRQSRIVITALAVAAVAASVAAAPAISGVEEPAVESARQQPAQQGTPAAGQQQEQTPPPAAQATLPGAPELLTPEEREALALVEQLIRDQEGVLMGTNFDYVERGRRDPFRSLVAGLTASAPREGERPAGLAGFLIGEIDVTAIAEVQGRWHAMVTAPDQRSYFLEVGTELWDGHVVSIGPGEVILEEIIADMTGARRTRQVTKRLRTTDGGWETP